MNAEADLEAAGATAVNAAALEQQILRHVDGVDPAAATNQNVSVLETQQQELWAIQREIRTVRATIAAQFESTPQADNNTNDNDATQQQKPNQSLSLAQNDLQKALMKERLAGLEKQAVQLEELLTAAGHHPTTQFPDEAALQQVLIDEHKKKRTATKHNRKKVQQQLDTLEEADLFEAADAVAGRSTSLVETERDRLIRLGVLTPFDRLNGFERRVEVSAQEEAASIARVAEKIRAAKASRHTTKLVDASELPRHERVAKRVDEGFWRAGASGRDVPVTKKKSVRRTTTLPRAAPHARRKRKRLQGGGWSDDVVLYGEEDDEVEEQEEDEEEDIEEDDEIEEEEEEEEPEEEIADVVFEGGFKVPGPLYAKLFDYQRTGVKWLWELYTQRAGGIIGDEMGLGKTIQIIAFLAGLHHSGIYRPSIIVCPATVLNQWLRELRTWYPPFRVAIFHDSGSGGQDRGALLRKIRASPAGVLLTTYDQLRLRRDELLPIAWGCAVLDEGHKIRNPDAEVTLVAKQLATVHRLIMTGSPIQNRLTELWSLFDFVFPGKLGTLPVFQAQFSIPIQIGGYANASPLQVAAAYRCAVVLRDLISPYLLRRRKSDVASSLPKKTERVLFCSLTPDQREMYKSYLASKELGDILAGNRAALAGIDVLRKICNHPDLLERSKWEGSADYGAVTRSGKLQVLETILEHWFQGGHKVLLFTQTQQMLDIIEKLVVSKQEWKFHRMDGSTPVAARSRLMDDFNNNPEVFIFLLTTRVGGLGVNLTGADRCIIFDPDWNPSTDAQARERAWRIGQSKEVTVYRLITSGTIEEKVYHRQVYKQFLTDKVLKDPRQKRFFNARDLSDLFTLGGDAYMGQGNTETAEIFASLDTEVKLDGEEEAGQEQPRQQQQGTSAVGGGRSSAGDDPLESGRQGAVIREEPNDEEQAGNAINNTGGSNEAQILKDLLDGTGVHAALDHDKIEGAHDPSHRIAQKEAAKVAKRAADALRQSRLQVQHAPVTAPTWTGRFGAAGAPAASNGGTNMVRFGKAANPRLHVSNGGGASASGGGGIVGRTAPRSSELLAKMRERNNAPRSMAAQSPELMHAQGIAKRIASYLHSRGGSAPSAQIVSAFQQTVKTHDLVLFKSVLKSVAALDKRRGVWVLKPEFVPDNYQ